MQSPPSVRPAAYQRVRLLQSDDLQPVANLWMRVFARRKGPAPQPVVDYFRSIFVNNPWRDEHMSSRVYVDSSGKIVGFLGVIPRLMKLGNATLPYVVSTQLMVDPAARQPLAAIQLVQHLFSGPQELTYSDGSNELAEMMWKRRGGETLPLYSLQWTRLLRPASYVLERAVEADRLTALARIIQPAGSLADWLGAHGPIPYYRPQPTSLRSEPATAETLLESFALSPHALHPLYDASTLGWVLARARESRRYGPLHARVVRDSAGRLCGSYVYYLKPGGIGQVLHISASTSSAPQVIEHLFQEGAEQGALAMTGQVQPKLLQPLSAAKCTMACRDMGVTIYSRNRDVLSALHRGDAAMTRLDGEWWLRLGVDRALDWSRE